MEDEVIGAIERGYTTKNEFDILFTTAQFEAIEENYHQQLKLKSKKKQPIKQNKPTD